MKPKFSLREIIQEIDLDEVTGRTLSDVEKRIFMDDAINLIIERTQSGVDINGRPFKQYSKDYAKEKGVSRGDVDLTLTSSMLAAISGTETGNGVSLFIDDSEVPKAYNHNVGDTLPKRTFFGLTTKEIEELSSGLGVANTFEERSQFNIFEALRNIGFILDEN